MAMLGNIFLDVVFSETPERSVKTTDHPVEEGEPVADHATKQPEYMGITGVINGPDASMRMTQIEQLQDSVTPVVYVHRNYVGGVIVEDFKRVHDAEHKGGFSFTMRLKKIKMAKSTPIKKLKLPARVQAKKVGNKGLQQKQTPAQLAAANGNRVKGNKPQYFARMTANENRLK